MRKLLLALHSVLTLIVAVQATDRAFGSLVSAFDGKSSSVNWTRINRKEQPYDKQCFGTAVLQCSTHKACTLLGDIVTNGQLSCTVTMWNFGLRDSTTLQFFLQEGQSNNTVATITRTSWYVLKTITREYRNITLNITHLVVSGDEATYTFQHMEEWNPFYWMAFAVLLNFGGVFLVRGPTSPYNITQLGVFMLCSKLVGLGVVGVWVSYTTLSIPVTIVMGVCTAIIEFFTVRFLAILYFLDDNDNIQWRKMLWLAGLSCWQWLIVGQTVYLLVTLTLTLVFQLWTKHSRFQRQGEVCLQDKMFVVCFLANILFNTPWLFFQQNFYRLAPPQSSMLVVALAVQMILVLLLVSRMPKWNCWPFLSKSKLKWHCIICTDACVGVVFYSSCGHLFHRQCIYDGQFFRCPIDSHSLAANKRRV